MLFLLLARISHTDAPGDKTAYTDDKVSFRHELTVKYNENEHLDNNDSGDGSEFHRTTDATEPLQKILSSTHLQWNDWSGGCEENAPRPRNI